MPKTIGIRREDKSHWERRAPLAPVHVETLVSQGIRVLAQPGQQRIFTDAEYERAGAVIEDDINEADLILAVKEIPPEEFRQNGAYLFFSHTIKGQSYNMPSLQSLLNLNCTLLDYEPVVDDQGRRLIFFGRFAGIVGAVETLRALGLRRRAQGFDTPLADMVQPNAVDSLEALKESVRAVGKRLAQGVPGDRGPIVIGFTGNGAVSKGAQEICKELPCEFIKPDQLPALVQKGAEKIDKVYLCVLEEEQLYTTNDPNEPFERQNYYDHPERFHSVFSTMYAPYLTAIVNGIFWTDNYPRLLTRDDLIALQQNPTNHLDVVGDVSCDIDGSMACTVRPSDIGEPSYVYNPTTGVENPGVDGDGIVVMAVDNLPCELSRDATMTFGNALTPFIPQLLEANVSGEAFPDLPPEFRKAIITHQGSLTPDYRYLKDFL